jgi:hypothetical protein
VILQGFFGSLTGLVGAAMVIALGVAQPADAQSRRFELTSDSSISVVCAGCVPAPPPPQRLEGSFEVTALPAEQPFGVVAVTGVRLHSRAFTITANGFWQRLGQDKQAMVLDAEVNGAKVLLTSGRRQYVSGRGISMVLSSGRKGSPIYVLVVKAQPVDDAPDRDADGVSDTDDNCVGQPNAGQSDGDGDGVGDACDKCLDSPAASRVTRAGCSLEQICPCAGPRNGGEWESLGTYLRCVSQSTRRLRREAGMSRAEGRAMIKRAVQSGCGRMVVALR